jgi:hypothetical protein
VPLPGDTGAIPRRRPRPLHRPPPVATAAAAGRPGGGGGLRLSRSWLSPPPLLPLVSLFTYLRTLVAGRRPFVPPPPAAGRRGPDPAALSPDLGAPWLDLAVVPLPRLVSSEAGPGAAVRAAARTSAPMAATAVAPWLPGFAFLVARPFGRRGQFGRRCGHVWGLDTVASAGFRSRPPPSSLLEPWLRSSGSRLPLWLPLPSDAL